MPPYVYVKINWRITIDSTLFILKRNTGNCFYLLSYVRLFVVRVYSHSSHPHHIWMQFSPGLAQSHTRNVIPTIGTWKHCVLYCPFLIKLAEISVCFKDCSQQRGTVNRSPDNGGSTVYQCSVTNVMYFLFRLLRIKSLYMFRALIAHPKEVLYKRQLVYCVCVKSVSCTRIWMPMLVQPTDVTRMQYTNFRLWSA
jgi:hypothetical protein